MNHVKRKLLFWESMYVLFIVAQIFFPETMSLDKVISGFILITFVKYTNEGLRLNLPIFFVAQILAIIFQNPFVRVIALALDVLGLFYFPIYSFPKTMGTFFSGYKILKLPDGHIASIFYPTTSFAPHPKYCDSEKPWKRTYAIQKVSGKEKPRWLYRFGLSYWNHIEMAVYEEATIVSKEHLSHTLKEKKFPVMIFSHGLGGNRNVNASLNREWACQGYLVFSIDHDEEIDIPPTMATSDMKRLRFDQLLQRKSSISSILDFISNQEKVRAFFDNEDIEIDLDRISISGHSFGAATATYVALHEKRITGVCVLLDPWLYPISDKIGDMQLNRPTMILRTQSFEKVLPEIYRNKESALELLTKNNRDALQHSFCGYFENSTHISQCDLILYMPRELVIFKELVKLSDAINFIDWNNRITSVFLKSMLYERDASGAKPKSDVVIKKFKNQMPRATLKVDKLEKTHQLFIQKMQIIHRVIFND